MMGTPGQGRTLTLQTKTNMTSISGNTSPSAPDAVDLGVRKIRLQEFSKRLQALLVTQNLSQADLSRSTGLGRDSISSYCRGSTVPTPKNLKRICHALKVEPEQLYPNYEAESVAAEEIPAFQLKAVHGDSQKTWLSVNMKVANAQALAILEILNTPQN